MKAVEIAVALICAAFGLRSVAYWVRHPAGGTRASDHALFALFVVGRAGQWFAFAGLFAIYASIGTQGRAFIDDARRYAWYVLVIAALAALQLVAGFFLSRRP
jgi:hypothetical protein